MGPGMMGPGMMHPGQGDDGVWMVRPRPRPSPGQREVRG